MFQDQKYLLSVKDPRTGELITTGVMAIVYKPGTKTLATLYKNEARIALANPITRARFAIDGKLSFFSAETTVDIFVADDKGNTAMIYGVTPTNQTVLLNRDGAQKMLVAPWVFNNNVETDTGLDFPQNAHIVGCVVQTLTIDATETIDVGILSTESGGDADGIAAAASIAVATCVPQQISPGMIAQGAAKSLSYTCSAGSDTGAGILFVEFIQLS